MMLSIPAAVGFHVFIIFRPPRSPCTTLTVSHASSQHISRQDDNPPAQRRLPLLWVQSSPVQCRRGWPGVGFVLEVLAVVCPWQGLAGAVAVSRSRPALSRPRTLA